MRRLYILCLFALGMANSISSQTLEQAKQQFLKGEFSAAKPVFSNLLKKSPSNSNYNFWYGACEYETGNAENAIPYLQKGAKALLRQGKRSFLRVSLSKSTVAHFQKGFTIEESQ